MIIIARKMTPEGRAFIARKIGKNREEGKSENQSVAIAYSQAKKEGYYVPPRRKIKDIS